MAIHLSAVKRARQNEKRSLRNLNFKTKVKSSIRKVREAIEGKNAEESQKALSKTIPLIQKAHTKGIFHRKTSSRKISRLTLKFNALKSQSA